MIAVVTRRLAGRGVFFALSLPTLTFAQSSAPASAPSLQYLPYDSFAAKTREIASAGGASIDTLAKSAGGHDVLMLTIAAPVASTPEKRPAVLIVGGVDAECPGASEVALGVAETLLRDAKQADSNAAKLFQSCVFYVIPRLDPDGEERYCATPKYDDDANTRPRDDDRDGVIDEDPPNDIDGDGMISVMRRRDPLGEWMIDPDEPRLMKKADPAKGEKGGYSLEWEGVDDDNDGVRNEDPLGGVDEDRNWPHLYEAGNPRAGVHQLSEPATRALAQFVVDHPNIQIAIVYGRHDAITSVPKGTDKDPGGAAFRELNPDDVALYEFVSEKYREISGMKTSGGARPDGALYAWLYSQHGIPTFAIDPWWPLDREKPAPASAPSADSQPTSSPASSPASQPEARPEPKSEAKPADGERPRGGGNAAGDRPREGRGRRGAGGGGGGGGPPGGGPGPGPRAPSNETKNAASTAITERVESTEANRRWIKWIDDFHGGVGFIAWHEANHPTLGKVELGGFAPYLKTAPPAEELGALAAAQTRFLETVVGMRPQPRFTASRVKKAGADIWQVDLRLINDGVFPTHMAISRQLENPQIVIRPKVDAARIIGGRRMERVANLPGGGPASELQWLIRGAEGDTVEFAAFNRVYGEWKTSVTLRETPPGEEGQP